MPLDHEFDLDALARHLEEKIDGFRGPMTLEKFAGGQSNPTFRIRARSGDYVLRSQPLGALLASAHAVDREYRVARALAATPVPVPKVHYLCEDREVIGSLFYVMEFCDGRTFWNAALPELERADRRPVYEEMVRVLAELHGVDVEAAGLGDYGRPGNYFERQYSRWCRQYRASELVPIAAMDELIDWLGGRLPEEDGRVALVHGDFRLDNLVYHRERPEIVAVLDWELSTLGHPWADVGNLCMLLRIPSGVGLLPGLGGRDLAALGIPSESELVAGYCERAGIERIEGLEFYVAFSFFRLAAIAQGVAKRAVDGNASSRQATEVGRFVRPFAELGLAAAAGR